TLVKSPAAPACSRGLLGDKRIQIPIEDERSQESQIVVGQRSLMGSLEEALHVGERRTDLSGLLGDDRVGHGAMRSSVARVDDHIQALVSGAERLFEVEDPELIALQLIERSPDGAMRVGKYICDPGAGANGAT